MEAATPVTNSVNKFLSMRKKNTLQRCRDNPQKNGKIDKGLFPGGIPPNGQKDEEVRSNH